jgi:hypothetical protein
MNRGAGGRRNSVSILTLRWFLAWLLPGLVLNDYGVSDVEDDCCLVHDRLLSLRGCDSLPSFEERPRHPRECNQQCDRLAQVRRADRLSEHNFALHVVE